VSLLQQHSEATRKEIDELLWEKLPDILNEKQKRIKVSNLLSELSRKERTIMNAGTDKKPSGNCGWAKRFQYRGFTNCSE